MRRVIKLGGSLLGWPELGRRFADWLGGQPPARCALVAGGGAAVDRLRSRQREAGWDDATVHWLAVDELSQTAQQACAILKPLGAELCILQSVDQMFAPLGDPLRVIDCAEFLRHREPFECPPRLVCNWEVTSDSIAARLAQLASADELVLLKSASPRSASWEERADQGYVDSFFPRLVPYVAQVRWIDLRGHRPE
jgi:hypothetical protein